MPAPSRTTRWAAESERGFSSVLLAIMALLLAIVTGVSLAQPLSGCALDAIVSAQERALRIAPGRQPAGLSMFISSAASALLAEATGSPFSRYS